MSSITPTAAITTAPSRIARVWPSQGRKIQPASSTPARIASPESRGVGLSCRLRSLGRSIAPTLKARRSAYGTSSQAIAAAATKAKTASMVVGTMRVAQGENRAVQAT